MEGDSDDQNYMQRRHGQLGMVNCRIKQTLIGIWGTCRPDSGMCGSAELVHLLEREGRVCNELWAGACRSHLMFHVR